MTAFGNPLQGNTFLWHGICRPVGLQTARVCRQLDEKVIIPHHDLAKTFTVGTALPPSLARRLRLRKKSTASIQTPTRSTLICIKSPNFRRMKHKPRRKLAARLRSAGYDVTEHVGGTGVVAILKNGPGQSSCCARNSTRFLWKKKRVSLTPARCTRKTTPDTKSLRCTPADTICIWRRFWDGRDHGTQQKYLAWDAHTDWPTSRGNDQRRESNDRRRIIHAVSQAGRGRGVARGQCASRRDGRDYSRRL